MEESKYGTSRTESSSPMPPPPPNADGEDYDPQNIQLQPSSGSIKHGQNSGAKMSLDDYAMYNYREGSDAYPTLRKVSSPDNSYSRRSFDDSNFFDARMQKLASTEAAIREEMFRECTFRPKIKGLPSAYGPLKETGTPFVVRVNNWQRKKEQQQKVKQELIEKSETSVCTFQPKISRNSSLAIKEIRGESPDKATDRLYSAHRMIVEQREKLREEELMKEEKVIEMECTFHPQLRTRDHPSFQHVQSKFRYNTPTQAAQSSKALEQRMYSDFTFTPKVNKVKPNMTSAQLYLQTSVVDRLTRPLTNDNPHNHSTDEPQLRSVSGHDNMSQDGSYSNNNGRNVIDAATFLGSLQTGVGLPPPPPPSLPSTAVKGGKSKDMDVNSKVLKEEELQRFLQRQQMVVKKRDEEIKTIERAITPHFKPSLSNGTKKITKGRNDADFLLRVERDTQKRLSQEQAQEMDVNGEHSFKPHINKRASLQRSRSSFEMSRGDLLRKETNRRMLKLQIEQEELASMTFQPSISTRAKEYGRSRLRLNEDPTDFLRWTEERKAEKEKARQEELKKREEDELNTCTFAPQLTTCPAYIKRIAESINKMKTARSSASVVSEKPKPDWR